MDIWVDEIKGWDQRPFAGGYAALHDLADSSFSGAVSSGAAWVVFVNGRIVAVGQYRQGAGGASFEDADIEQFEDGEGTVYEAPHPAVPLLVAMQLANGETRGRYYTEQTPIEEVDGTLTSGNFTGYLELSENVLSGDYYTVYQAGRSMDLGFIGNARRLETDDEARETARDEVGIYEVVAVDLDVTPIPDPEGDTTATTGAAVAHSGADEGTSTNDGPAAEEETEQNQDASAGTKPDWASGDLVTDPGEAETAGTDTTDAETRTERTGATAPTGSELANGTSDPTDQAPEDPNGSGRTTPSEPDVESATTRVGDTDRVDGNGEDATGTVATATIEDEPPDGRDPRKTAAEGSVSASAESQPSDAPERTNGSGGGANASAAERLASRSIPSLDPDRSSEGDGGTAAGNRRDRPGERKATASGDGSADEPDQDASDANGEELATMQGALASAEADRDEARERAAELESEVQRLEAELEERTAEIERLRNRVAELDSQGDGSVSGPSLSVSEAFAGTNLFVRYRSKGETTVEDVHGGAGTQEDLDANLRIASHTQFETEGAIVAGEPFGEWLEATQQYRFAEWLVSRLVFEIRDTGSADRMPDIYDALPEIDRIEFDGSVTVPDGDGERSVAFDVVCRDRMGDPLVVANTEASREPVGEAAMATLVQDAAGVCRAEASLAGAFHVTAAFYESDALETAADATDSSLLSRDSRLSYVKESRKRGFHLGLVESRDGDFHLAVPDL